MEAPLSHIIPFLAWNPVFLLIIGFLLLAEYPSPLGISGCFIVLGGAYLISTDAKNKEKKTKNSLKVHDKHEKDGETDSLSTEFDTEEGQKRMAPDEKFSGSNHNFLVQMVISIWNFKAGMYIMGVSLLWYSFSLILTFFFQARTFSSILEKVFLFGHDIPPPFFLSIQRLFMSIPVMFYCAFARPEFIDHIFTSFHRLLLCSALETATVVTYFMVYFHSCISLMAGNSGVSSNRL